MAVVAPITPGPNGGMGTAPKGDHERSLGQLTGDLVNQVATLMRDELGLAKVEMAEKGKWAGVGAGLSSASGVAAFFGAGCLTACAVAALSLVMPVWAAALIVGGFYLAVAGVVFLLGRNQMRRAAPPVPEETVESLKEDVECLKAHARSTRP